MEDLLQIFDEWQKKPTEASFAKLVEDGLRKGCAGYQVMSGACLLYKIHFDGEGTVCPNNLASPVRDQLAFETDILIRDSKVPLVAIELKIGHFTTHDVLTYSAKALRHKELYPYLRYGFVVGGMKKIQNRFFTHNSGFDFAFMFLDIEKSMDKLVEMVLRQIKTAEKMKSVMNSEVSGFETLVEFS